MRAIPPLVVLMVAVVIARVGQGTPSIDVPVETPTVQPPLAPFESGGGAVLEGIVVRACPGPPERGCQGQGIPGTLVTVSRRDGTTVSTLLTHDDGSFRSELAPGCYVVKDVSSGQETSVHLLRGQSLAIELDVPR